MPRAVAGRFECDSPIRGAITWTRVPRLKTDARCQYALAGRLVGVCLDISFHRRRTNAAPSLARIRSSYRYTYYQQDTVPRALPRAPGTPSWRCQEFPGRRLGGSRRTLAW